LSFELFYHPAVKEDLAQINERLKKRIKTALETRTSKAPERYGEPLRKNLKGLWKMRVGDYRVVYKIGKKEVIILAIVHRRKVYGVTDKRKS